MKKAVLLGERKAGLVDVEIPAPKGRWALVKVHAAPLCTEWKKFAAGRKADYLGHEAAGEVVAVGEAARCRVGDRVVVMPQYPCGECELCKAGDFIHCENELDYEAHYGTREGKATVAQYLLKPDWLLPRIPDGVSYDRASLACCGLGPSFGAVKAMDLQPGESMLIVGVGPVGLGALVNAVHRRAVPIVVESNPWRAERARAMGAQLVLDPAEGDLPNRIRQATGGRGSDCALDCSGSPAGERLCLDATRRKGRVTFIGECGEDLVLRASPDLIRKGLSVSGVWHYNLNHFSEVMDVIRTSPLLELLISHVLPMTEIEAAMELAASGKAAKIIINPWN